MRTAILVVLMAMAFFSCDKDTKNTGNKLNLVFQLKYGGEPLASQNELYRLNDSVQMRFSKVSFYLSDFKLNSESESLSMLDVLHISFLQNISGDAVQEIQQTLRFEVPAGNYTSLSFGLGVNPTQNATTPATHEPGSALSLSSEYWPAWKSYIFDKIEGTYKLNDEAGESVALHVGGDETYRILEWKDGFTIGDKPKEIIIPIDLKFILKDYPITEAPVLHQLGQLPYMDMLADKFSESMQNKP